MTVFAEELTAPNKIRIHEGDIFAYRMHGTYRYLRVIRDLDMPGKGRVILYFYNPTSPIAENVPRLDREDLLLHPFVTWREYLRDGFTLRVAKQPFAPGDRYERHCFHNIDVRRTKLYCDEFGNEYDEKFEPFIENSYPLSFDATEIRIAKALGWIQSSDDMDVLPELRRPLLRQSLSGKLPNRYVRVIIPGFRDSVGPRLGLIYKVSFGNGEAQLGSIVLHELYKTIQRTPGFSQVAEQGWHFVDGDSAILNMAVKKRQFSQFYEMIDSVLKSVNIRKYFIADSVLGDWLHGTYKDPNHQTL